MVTVQNVKKGSAAERMGLRAGDFVVTVNGGAVNDVLDYDFYSADDAVRIVYRRGGEEKGVSLWHRAGDPIGLEFSTYLMDEKRRCRNGCIFCFIDQNPPGMRESIYFKDDDERLSFLQGNYVTLTNLSPSHIDRIIKMHISPINVSVHTTDPLLRVSMMKNRNAGRVLGYLDRLSDAGIEINAQLVLCRGINDGAQLDRTLSDLSRYDTLASVACVPAGVTAYRDGLPHIEPYDRESARGVISAIDAHRAEFLKTRGRATVYASDEFYLLAGLPMPDAEYYEGYPQLDNGVGMLRSHYDEFVEALKSAQRDTAEPFTVVTGMAALEHIRAEVELAKKKFPFLEGETVGIRNRFFGETVTVTGLVVGRDIIEQLSAAGHRGRLVLPASMLRAEGDLFLDDTSLEQLGRTLGVRISISDGTGGGFLDALLDK